MERVKGLNARKPYQRKIKPFNFLNVGLSNKVNPDTDASAAITFNIYP